MLIKSFESFSNRDGVTKRSRTRIESICKEHKIINYSINVDGSIDVDGSVDLMQRGLRNFPLKFRHITGDFNCSINQLTSLVGGPESVGRRYSCNDNRIDTLQGCNTIIRGDFSCHHNRLKNLEGCPEIGFDLIVYSNEISSLKGCPESINGDLHCYNNFLTSFEGGPKRVEGCYYVSENRISSFKGFPDYVRSECMIYKNPIAEIYELFNTIKCIDPINEYDVIQGDKIIRSRLEEVYSELEMEIPEDIELKYYKLVD